MTCFPDEVNWNNKEFTKEMLDYLRAVYCVHPMVLDALDYINSLESRIAELEAERHWIPVSERLPEENAPVLVLTVLGGMFVDFIYGKSVVTGNPGFYELDIEDVTHWMPLPTPPEVK